MHVQELWRYPVKSMRGERIATADLDTTGIRGDRNIVVVSPAGDRIITSRTHPGLLGLHATISPSGDTQGDTPGEVLIDGLPWDSPEALALTRKAAGEPVHLIDAGTRVERFDVLPLLVGTDGAFQKIGLDSRRMRPNIIIGDVEGNAERDWPAKSIRSGSVLIHVAQLRARCVMTTYDPDTLQQNLGVLRRIVKEAGGKLALDCSVTTPGTLKEGDPIALEEPRPAT